MKYQEQRFTLDLQKHQSHTIVNVFQGDTAVRLYISLTDGGKPYTLNPERNHAILYGMRSDGKPIIHECDVISEAEIMYEFQPATTYVLGMVNCQCRIFSSEDQLLTAPRFSINVEERVVDDDEYSPSDEDISRLDKIFIDEGIRVENENTRLLAETSRGAAEVEREQKEGLRDEAEKARGTAEAARVAAETARNKAEKERDAAETARKEADKDRDTKIQSAIDIANDALELAGVAGGGSEEVGERITSGINTHNNATDAHENLRKALTDAIAVAINTHNSESSLTHADIRGKLNEFMEKVNAILAVGEDDKALDQLQEIVTYIKNNKSLIDGITTNKVNVSDIVDSLDSDKTKQPLSAKQGQELKSLIDKKVSIIGNDSKLRRAYVGEGGTPEDPSTDVSLVDMRTGFNTEKDTIKATSIVVRGNPSDSKAIHPGTFEISHPHMTPNKYGDSGTAATYSEYHPLTVGMALKYFVTNSEYQKLLPKVIAITSFYIEGGGVYENGAYPTEVTVRWTLNQTPYSVKLNNATQQNVSSAVRKFTNAEGFKSGAWTLTVSDKTNTDTKTISLSFVNGVYYGTSDSATFDDDLINGLTNKELRSSKLSSISVDGGEGKYIYYAHPTSYGKVSFKDADEGFGYGFQLVGDSYSFTNAYGYQENYYVYRSSQKIPGTSNITII